MHKFYYDESEHSRKITYRTLIGKGYYDGFVSVIVGWDENDEADIAKEYESFERKHKDRMKSGEIKSTTIKPGQLKHGFASLSKTNASLIESFLKLFDEKIRVYICYESKLEFVVEQLLKGYENSRIIDVDLMRYSMVKALVQYQPKDVIEAIYNNPSILVDLLKAFFYKRIKEDLSNVELKRKEIDQFGQILMLLQEVNPIETIDWSYTMPFVGFKEYLAEVDINEYSLVIDREERTERSARIVGIDSVSGADSKEVFGLRMADMLAGIITKLMKALHDELRYHDESEFVKRRLADESWFRLYDKHFALYKLLGNIILQMNNAWFKVFAGAYSDDLVIFIELLRLMQGFENADDLRDDADGCPERLNSMACASLYESYKRIMDKNIGSGHVKSHLIGSRASTLPLGIGYTDYEVMSVGFDGLGAPLILVDEGTSATCYRLPNDLSKWAYSLMSLAGSEYNVLPSLVRFTTNMNKHYVDIL